MAMETGYFRHRRCGQATARAGLQNHGRPLRRADLHSNLLWQAQERATPYLNTFTGKTERIGRLVEMHANERIEIDSATAGDIVALDRHEEYPDRAHPLCDPKFPATLEPMVFPEPVIYLSRVAKGQGQLPRKWAMALSKMIQEDPSFRVETDVESGEVILKGMGELHLDIKVDILAPHPWR